MLPKRDLSMVAEALVTKHYVDGNDEAAPSAR